MTRINCVPVTELSNKHLVAEYRELPRVYGLSLAAVQRGDDWRAHPEEYCLGTGHVTFFYSRIRYVVRRHRQLIAEMQRRGFRTEHTDVPSVILWPKPWRRMWLPTEEAKRLNRARIRERGGA